MTYVFEVLVKILTKSFYPLYVLDVCLYNMSVVVRYWSWVDAAEQVTHLDAKSGTVTISKPTQYGLRLGTTGF